jgi:predicted Zn-dependent protease with MMP-like domain
MTAHALSKQEIIMNFSSAPTADDISVLAMQIVASPPDEISACCEELVIAVEEFPDDVTEAEMELETPYELLALFRSGKEIAPGVEKKVANGEDVLVLYRRPILDLWCETGDDLNALVREIVIEEIARTQEFSENDIAEMLKRYTI